MGSGFDFDSFFDECLQSSTSCNAREVKNQANPIVTSHQNNPFEKHQQVLPAGKVEKQTNSPSLQHDPCKPCHQVEVPASSQSLNPQPSLTGLPGMKFDSDAFFDDFLGSTNSRHGTVSLKTSAVAWGIQSRSKVGKSAPFHHCSWQVCIVQLDEPLEKS